jgi:hypothetical protein
MFLQSREKKVSDYENFFHARLSSDNGDCLSGNS